MEPHGTDCGWFWAWTGAGSGVAAQLPPAVPVRG
jgi:hypothetical protein